MKQVILDTDILSYILTNRYPEVTAIANQYYRVFRYFTVSAMSISEVVEGLALAQNAEALTKFLRRADGFQVLPVGMEEALIAGNIFASLKSQGTKIGAMDPFIAAVAIAHQMPLVTNNQKHYQRIVDLGFPLKLENWRSN